MASNVNIPVLTDPPDEIVCYANIQCTAGTTGEDVDVVQFHGKAFRCDLREPSFLCHHRGASWSGLSPCSVITGLVPVISIRVALPS
jgi:hypothetical protein